MIRCAKINVIIDPTLCATCEAKRLILYNLLEFFPLQLVSSKSQLFAQYFVISNRWSETG